MFRGKCLQRLQCTRDYMLFYASPRPGKAQICCKLMFSLCIPRSDALCFDQLCFTAVPQQVFFVADCFAWMQMCIIWIQVPTMILTYNSRLTWDIRVWYEEYVVSRFQSKPLGAGCSFVGSTSARRKAHLICHSSLQIKSLGTH